QGQPRSPSVVTPPPLPTQVEGPTVHGGTVTERDTLPRNGPPFGASFPRATEGSSWDPRGDERAQRPRVPSRAVAARRARAHGRRARAHGASSALFELLSNVGLELAH